ncbi:MAG: diguanylate cyclase [Zoogloeaceae bacterium]|jgi:diguanylate cyclase (GGDEF)-like protein|nr:diguanylate cyclase [Zoogloeaceae bacterium]
MGSILLAHDSKVIRAALTRYLRESYSILEALDGDAAWHALVLNHDIVAIIAGPDLGRLNGMDLLDRVRHNSLERLKHIPFYLIGSQSRIETLSDAAKKAGATDFIFNDMGAPEILAIIQRHDPAAELSFTDASKKAGVAAEVPGVKAPPVSAASAPVRRSKATRARSTALLSVSLFADGVRRMCSHPGGQAAVMLFALDGYKAVASSLGVHTASAIIERLAHLVQAKIGASDVIGHYQPGCFAVATMNSGLNACVAFAQRLAKSLSSAHIAFHGQPVLISISVGIASRPEDGGLDGDALLELARARLHAAIAAGGGRIQAHGAG